MPQLEESLDALLTLPEASMFRAESLSPVWTEVVERTTRFLRAVVTGDRDPFQKKNFWLEKWLEIPFWFCHM